MNTDKSSHALIQNWRKSRKCINQPINNEPRLQRRRRTESNCTSNINCAGQSHLERTSSEEPAAPPPRPHLHPPSEFECTVNYLRCLPKCEGRNSAARPDLSGSLRGAGAEGARPAADAPVLIYLPASGYASASWAPVLQAGPDWAAPNDMPQCCRQGALGWHCRRLWIAGIPLRHGMSTLLTLARCGVAREAL